MPCAFCLVPCALCLRFSRESDLFSPTLGLGLEIESFCEALHLICMLFCHGPGFKGALIPHAEYFGFWFGLLTKLNKRGNSFAVFAMNLWLSFEFLISSPQQSVPGGEPWGVLLLSLEKTILKMFNKNCCSRTRFSWFLFSFSSFSVYIYFMPYYLLCFSLLFCHTFPMLPELLH